MYPAPGRFSNCECGVKLRPRAKHRSDRMTVEALNSNFAIPTGLHYLRQTIGVVLVTLVDLRTHRCLCVASIKAHHRKTHRFQSVPMPGAERATFQPNPHSTFRLRPDRCRDVVWCRTAFPLPDRLAIAANNAQMGQLLRHIQTDDPWSPPLGIIAGAD